MREIQMTNELLTLDEVCTWLKVPRSWVYRQTREGTIPFVKLGKYLRFFKPQLEKWLIKNQVAVR